MHPGPAAHAAPPAAAMQRLLPACHDHAASEHCIIMTVSIQSWRTHQCLVKHGYRQSQLVRLWLQPPRATCEWGAQALVVLYRNLERPTLMQNPL